MQVCARGSIFRRSIAAMLVAAVLERFCAILWDSNIAYYSTGSNDISFAIHISLLYV